MIRSVLMSCLAVLVALGCASTAQIKRTDPITILLNNGDKIGAEVVDIHNNKVIFKAQDWKKAYEYGEVINIERVKGIRLNDGRRLSVKEYDAFRKGGTLAGTEVAERRKFRARDLRNVEGESLAYEELKEKSIAEMTDNEFTFFMVMKEKELAAQKAKTDEKPVAAQKERPVEVIVIGPQNQAPTVSTKTSEGSSEKVAITFEEQPEQNVLPGRPAPSSGEAAQLDDVADLLFDADLAVPLLSHLNNKKELTASEASLLALIENNPEWQDKIDDLSYLDRTAKRSLERVYLYNPDDLNTKLGLQFDKDLDMDYEGLMAQLHRKLGGDVKMADFRTLLEVFGESGSRAMKEILENYDSWRFATSQDRDLVGK